jgi:hypothetical protein
MQPFVNTEIMWEYEKPVPLNRKLLLLTKDNQCVVGAFKGPQLPDNKTYKAWFGLPDRNQELERQLGYI